MKTIVLITFGFFAVGLYSCKDDSDRIDDPAVNETVELNYSFGANDEGWDAGIAGFPIEEESLYEFETKQVTSPLDEDEGVLLLSASNPNENLFMYASKHITGLAPNSRYDISYTVEFASSVEIDTTEMVTDTTGIGTDTPGVGSDTLGFVNVNDTVVIKAGATSEELVTEEDDLDFLQLVGIDVGEPGVDGDDLVVLGSFASDTTSNGFTLHTADRKSVV